MCFLEERILGTFSMVGGFGSWHLLTVSVDILVLKQLPCRSEDGLVDKFYAFLLLLVLVSLDCGCFVDHLRHLVLASLLR